MMILSPIEQLLRKDGASLSKRSQSLLNVAEVNAHRLLRLINQLLDSAKIEAGHMQLNVTLVDLNALIEQLVTAAGPLVEQRGLQLLTQLTPSLSAVAGDEEKLDIVLTNLISNAIKFTPRGGTIWISTEIISPGNSVFDQELVRVSVDDTGVGIEPANFDRMFERFVQVDGSTSREFTGTGLGLALVKEFVELHQGSIDVQSQPGIGSRFSVSHAELGKLGEIELPMPGEHNVQNALATIAVGLAMGLEFGKIAAALADFRGVHRRFEHLGEWRGAQVIDDYAHHPTEVSATLAAARAAYPGAHLHVVFHLERRGVGGVENLDRSGHHFHGTGV